MNEATKSRATTIHRLEFETCKRPAFHARSPEAPFSALLIAPHIEKVAAAYRKRWEGQRKKIADGKGGYADGKPAAGLQPNGKHAICGFSAQALMTETILLHRTRLRATSRNCIASERIERYIENFS